MNVREYSIFFCILGVPKNFHFILAKVRILSMGIWSITFGFLGSKFILSYATVTNYFTIFLQTIVVANFLLVFIWAHS